MGSKFNFTSAAFGSSVFGETDGENVENYRAVATLRGHLKGETIVLMKNILAPICRFLIDLSM